MIQEEVSSVLQKIVNAIKTAFTNAISNIKTSLISKLSRTVIICAVLSVLFLNLGFLSFFYLAPLGYAILVCGSALIPFLATAVLNIVFGIILRLIVLGTFSASLQELLYFSILFLCFSWIMDGKTIKIGLKIRTMYRFVISCAVSAIAFFIFIMGGSNSRVFDEIILSQADLLSSLMVTSAENILNIFRIIMLRGGAVFSMFFIFFINRQISFNFLKIIKKKIKPVEIMIFHAPANTIWVLSCSLAVILISNVFKSELLAIPAWNLLVICTIIFMTQGSGILMHFLSGRTPVFRLIVYISFFFIIFSPLSVVFIVLLMLLGIAENWLPFRKRTIQ